MACSVYFFVILVLLINILYSHCGGVLTVYIPPYREECFSLLKSSGDRLLIDAQLKSGHRLDVRLNGPMHEQISLQRKQIGVKLNTKVAVPGMYTFCFLNIHTYTEPAVVRFEYDKEYESKKDRLTQQIQIEKAQYAVRQMHDKRPKVPDGVLSESDRLYQEIEKNNTYAGVEEQMVVIGLRMDVIRHHLQLHTSNLYYQYYLQTKNRNYVTYFSATICFLMLIVGGIQTYVLKWFFK